MNTFMQRARRGGLLLWLNLTDEDAPSWHRITLLFISPLCPLVWLLLSINDDMCDKSP